MPDTELLTLSLTSRIDDAEAGVENARLQEWASIFRFYRLLAQKIEERAVGNPALMLAMISPRHPLRISPDEVDLIHDQYVPLHHSGQTAERWDSFRRVDPDLREFELLELRGPDGERISFHLKELVVEDGSIRHRAKLFSSVANLPIVVTVLGGLFSMLLATPEAGGAWTRWQDARVARHVELQLGLGTSTCVRELDYKIDVASLRQAADGSYDFHRPALGEMEKRRRICNVQVSLSILGYDSLGPIDGIWGKKSAGAWEAFRKQRNLSGPVQTADYVALAKALTEQLEYLRKVGLK